MTTELRIVLIIASFVTSALMLRRIRRSKVRIEDSVFWIGLSAVILVMSVFPQIADACAAALHIYQTTNFLFMFFIFVLLVKLFAMSVHVSQLESKLEQAIQEQALSTYVLEDQASDTTAMRENAQQEAVLPHKALVSQEAALSQEAAVSQEALVSHKALVSQEATVSQEAAVSQEALVSQEAAVSQEATVSQEVDVLQEAKQCATWEDCDDATTQNVIAKETATQTYAEHERQSSQSATDWDNKATRID